MIESLPTQSFNKSVQQNQAMDFGVPSLPPSASDLFESGGRHLPLPPGRESWESVWPGAFGQAANNVSKGSAAFLCSPKWKRRTLSKAVNGKTKEKTKNRMTKEPADDWTLSDLSAAVSNLSSSKVSSCGNDVQDRTMFSEDDDEDDDRALLFGRKEISDERVKDPMLYSELAAETVGIVNFTKIAYPELFGHSMPPFKEPFYEKKLGIQR